MVATYKQNAADLRKVKVQKRRSVIPKKYETFRVHDHTPFVDRKTARRSSVPSLPWIHYRNGEHQDINLEDAAAYLREVHPSSAHLDSSRTSPSQSSLALVPHSVSAPDDTARNKEPLLQLGDLPAMTTELRRHKASSTSSMQLATQSNIHCSAHISANELNRIVKHIVKGIAARENLVRQLQQLFLEAHGTKRSVAAVPRLYRSAVEVIDLLRRATIELVEKITWWRQGHQDDFKVFLWNGVNYLSKISSDLDFVDNDHGFVSSYGISLTHNPLAIFPVQNERSVEDILLNGRRTNPNPFAGRLTLGMLGRQVSRVRARAVQQILRDEEKYFGQFVRTTAELEQLPRASMSRNRLVKKAIQETRIVPKKLQDDLASGRQQQHAEEEQRKRLLAQVCH